jgi:tetratricopeptide (TPR) repeat protein
MGRCYRLNGEYDKALASLEKAVKSRPNDGLNNFELGLLYHDMGRSKDAVRRLERVLDVWAKSDAQYRYAVDARAKLREWRSQSGR